jgi:hypothetical protein
MHCLFLLSILAIVQEQVDARAQWSTADTLEVSLHPSRHQLPSSSANLRSSLPNHSLNNASKPAAFASAKKSQEDVAVATAWASVPVSKESDEGIGVADQVNLASTLTPITAISISSITVDPFDNLFGVGSDNSIYKFGKIHASLAIAYGLRYHANIVVR